MRWEHSVSPAWLRARKEFNGLTATEASKLLPEYKRHLKKPGDIPPGFAGLWAEKHSASMPDAQAPSSAAARGHIMEPYAVGEFNKWITEDRGGCDPNKARRKAGTAQNEMFHWDDCLIANEDLGIGFSPDALSVEQQTMPLLRVSGIQFLAPDGAKYQMPSFGLEIKSYDDSRHIKKILEGKEDHEEIMQVAAAFATVPTLESMYLAFFNPSAVIPLHVEEYKRNDKKIQEMMKLLTEMAKLYREVASKMDEVAAGYDYSCSITESEIYMEYIDNKLESTGATFPVRGY